MSKQQTRSVTIRINGKEIEGTMRNIRRETMKLRNEINNKLTPGTDQYNRKVKELQGYNKIISDHNARLRGTSGIWGSISKEVKQFGVLAASYFGASQIVGGVQNFIRASADLDEQLADVRKVTGLTADEVRDLASELKKIDTRSSRAELLELSYVAGKLGIQGQKDILGFVNAADKINVSLGKDLGADAVQEIGKMVSIFNLQEEFGIEEGMLKIASAINDIGMASTASEGFLVEFTKRMAGISGLAKISAADNIALAGTLDSLGQTSETSSTAISKTFIQMGKRTQEFAKVAKMDLEEFRKLMEEDSVGALIAVLEQIGATEGGLEELTKALGDIGADGGRVVGVLGSLATKTEELRRQQEISNKAFEQGTSVTEEFDLKNATLGATLAKLGKAIRQEIVQPEFIEWLKSAAYWISENIKEIIGTIKTVGKLLAVYLSYVGAIKAITAILAVYNGLQKAGIALTTSQRIATILLYKAKKILAMNIGTAAKAQRLFNLLFVANPIGAFLALLAAAGTAYVLFSKNVKEATTAQRVLNDVRAEAEKSVAKEKASLDTLLRVAKDETLSKWERQKAIRAINDISPKYLGNINLENINTQKSKEAIDEYIKALDRKAMAMALNNKKVELYQKLIDEQNKSNNDSVGFWKQVEIAIFKSANVQDFFNKKNAQGSKNRMANIRSIEEEIEALNDLIKIHSSENVGDGSGIINDLIGDTETTAQNINDISKEVESFYQFLQQMREENLMRSMADDDKEVNQVRKKYSDQLAVAKQFWGEESEQYKSLLELRNEEIQEIEDKFAEEEEEKKIERREAFAEKWKELNDEIWLESIEDLREKALAELALEEEKELAKLENFEEFEELKLLVEEKYRNKRAAINKKFDDAEAESTKAKTALTEEEWKQAAASIASTLGDAAGMMNKGSKGWKAMKVAEATISTTLAAQKSYEAMAGIPVVGPALGALAAGVAVASGLANIKEIMNTDIPEVPEQYYTGGFNVKGGQDGKTYNATFSNQSGGYVGSKNPNIVLGGEQGEEYWMNADMLRNPIMADIAQAMEAYRTNKIAIPDFNNIVSSITANTQMKSGGYTSSSTWKGKTTSAPVNDNETVILLREIADKLGTPVPAIFDYDYFTEETEFMDSIKDIAKG